ncbi:MAG: hypothetical protein NT009_06905 [Proteobacteria bacterium]|nr:hypothetical protein [Pseudomonadota bacterium]
MLQDPFEDLAGFLQASGAVAGFEASAFFAKAADGFPRMDQKNPSRIIRGMASFFIFEISS